MAPPRQPWGMVALSGNRWRTLERWSPVLFLLGGGGVITHAAVQAIEAFTAITAPPDVFVTTGHLIALVGLLGLYPALARESPRLAAAGLVATGIGVGAWIVMTVGQFLAIAGAIESLTALFPGAFFVGVLGTTILAYTVVGSAALRAGGRPTVDGLLILSPAVLLAVLIGKSAVAGVGAADGVVIGAALALSMLLLGLRLQSWPRAVVDPAPAVVASG